MSRGNEAERRSRPRGVRQTNAKKSAIDRGTLDRDANGQAKRSKFRSGDACSGSASSLCLGALKQHLPGFRARHARATAVAKRRQVPAPRFSRRSNVRCGVPLRAAWPARQIGLAGPSSAGSPLAGGSRYAPRKRRSPLLAGRAALDPCWGVAATPPQKRSVEVLC
jgi:hypothetical protein